MEMELAIEIFGVAAGLLYLYLEIKQRNAMWVVGILMALVYIYIFATQELYASMAFQCYYFAVSIYGLAQWKKGKGGSKSAIVVNKMKSRPVLVSSLIAVIVLIISFWLTKEVMGDPRPLLDSVVMTLSALATYWLSRAYIEQWLVWIVVNIISVILYYIEGLYPTAALYAVYVVAAIYGYRYWRKAIV